VADHAQVAPGAEPGPDKTELSRVDVLELVDEKVPVAPARGGGELGVALQGVGQAPQEVVEVEEAPAGLFLLVALVIGGDLARWPGRGPAGGDHYGLVAGRVDQAGLGPLDLAGHVGGVGGGRRTAAQHGREEADLALEQRRRRPALP